MSVTRDDDISHCVSLVREYANDLYLADLLLPKTIRNDIFALHAFHVEIGNTIFRTNEPAMGEIRLQWWAEVIDGEREGEAQGHPVARLLLDVIDRHNLPVDAFQNKLQAHQFDLYNDPMGDRTMLEGYLGETRSSLFQLAGIIAGSTDLKKLAEMSGHSGVAAGIIWLLDSLASHRRQHKIYVPSDLLMAVGLDAQTFLTEVPTNPHEQVVKTLVEMAQEHHQKAEIISHQFPKALGVVFKHNALIPIYLKMASDNHLSCFEKNLQPSQFRRQWGLLKY